LLWSNPQLSIFHIRITYITLIISPAVNFSHENYLLCQIPQLSILHMRITHHALIKSLTINFSHENHLSCFDQIHSCPFFTWESLGMIWSNPQLSNIHMRITCFALIKSPAVNFSHENHLLCFDQILICQFFTWESLVMLWSNPHLSIYITLIKSPSVNLYYFDQIPNCQFFAWESFILLWSNPHAVNFSHKNHLSCFDQIHSCP
jgi:hypothetical protein